MNTLKFEKQIIRNSKISLSLRINQSCHIVWECGKIWGSTRGVLLKEAILTDSSEIEPIISGIVKAGQEMWPNEWFYARVDGHIRPEILLSLKKSGWLELAKGGKKYLFLPAKGH